MAEASKRVLVVDDEADAREFVRTVMEEVGCETIEAVDGEEGLAAAQRQKPDLIVLDVQMPKKDGYAVFAELRKDETTKDIPVVMLTAVSARTGVDIDAEQVREFLGSEPEAYIDKPIDPAALGDVVKRLLGE